MKVKIDASYLSSRLVCSHEEKVECLETVKILCKLNTLVRNKGIFAISDVVDEIEDSFLKMLLCTAEEQYGLIEDIRDVFEAYLIAGNYHGKEFLKNLLITEGLSNIYSNTRTSDLVTSLQCWFGAEFASTYRSELCEKSNPNFEPMWHEKSAVEEFDLLCTLSDDQITALFTEVDLRDLAISFRYSSATVGERLLSYLSQEDRQALQQYYQYTQFPRMADVQIAQKRILALVEKVAYGKEKNL